MTYLEKLAMYDKKLVKESANLRRVYEEMCADGEKCAKEFLKERTTPKASCMRLKCGT